MIERDATFSEADAGRIARSVRHTERTAGDLAGPRPHRPVPTRKRHVGVAEIITNDDKGAYTITVQRGAISAAGVLTYSARTEPAGLVAAAAVERRGVAVGGVGQLVRYWDEYADLPDDETGMRLVIDVGEIFYGKPAEAFSGPAETVTLDPCTRAGTDNGAANLAVHLKADRTSYTMPSVDGTPTTLATTIIVPFTLGADGKYYVLGAPVTVVTDVTYNTTDKKFYKKVRAVWVQTVGTESINDEIIDLVDCTGV